VKPTAQTPKKQRTDEYRVVRKRLSSIKPSPENEQLYRKTANDPDIDSLAESITARGLQEPLIITSDNFIISGHRRYTAMQKIRQVVAPCRVMPIRRDEMDRDEYICLLREHNRQRRKSVVEQVREDLVDDEPDTIEYSLRSHEASKLHAADYAGLTLEIEGEKHRCAISDQKADHVKYIKQVVFKDRKDYWPLSVRAVHYALLNYRFMRNIPRELRYQNDDKSYQATSELITRLRLIGEIPWDSLSDGTRPRSREWNDNNVQGFVRREFNGLLTGYERDLLQSQTCHVEILCEKNTIYGMATSVAREYQLIISSGRGFNSIDPWKEMVDRFRNSGKKRLVVIVLSDFDPEGEMIPQVGGRTLHELGLSKSVFDIVKAGVTREQINANDLPPMNFAKESSSNHAWFVDRNNGDDAVYELEALEPHVMLTDLREVIKLILDIDAFNREVEIRNEEVSYLSHVREKANEALEGVIEELEDQDE